MNSFEFRRWSSKKSSTEIFELWAGLIETDNLVEMKSRIKSGELNPFIETINGLTPMHLACIQGSLKTVKFLAELGVDINATSKLGRTPVQECIFHGHVDCMDELLKRGAILGTPSRKSKAKRKEMELHKN